MRQIADGIKRFGFMNPVLISGTDEIIADHGRVEAAKLLGLARIPVLSAAHLSDAERRAYVLADNKIAENAGWDKDLLAIELQGLIDFDFDIELTGFALAEVDLVLDQHREADPAQASQDAADVIPALPPGPAVTNAGDVWHLGSHRLICGDARDAATIAALLAGERVDLIFADPPYNVAIDGHVGGLGKVKCREFAFASGEMTELEFTAFLRDALAPAAAKCREGAIALSAWTGGTRVRCWRQAMRCSMS